MAKDGMEIAAKREEIAGCGRAETAFWGKCFWGWMFCLCGRIGGRINKKAGSWKRGERVDSAGGLQLFHGAAYAEEPGFLEDCEPDAAE